MPWRSKSDCKGEKGNFQSGHQQDLAGRTRRFTSVHLILQPLGEAGALLPRQPDPVPAIAPGTKTDPSSPLPSTSHAPCCPIQPVSKSRVATLSRSSPPSLPPAPPTSSRTLVPSWGGRALPTPAAAFLPSSRGKASPRPVSAQKQPVPLYLLLQKLPPTTCSTCTIQTAWSWQLLLHPCFPSETVVFSPLIPSNFQLHTQKAAATLGSLAQPSTPAQICFDVLSRWHPCTGERVPNSLAQLLLTRPGSCSVSPSSSPSPPAPIALVPAQRPSLSHCQPSSLTLISAGVMRRLVGRCFTVAALESASTMSALSAGSAAAKISSSFSEKPNRKANRSVRAAVARQLPYDRPIPRQGASGSQGC